MLPKYRRRGLGGGSETSPVSLAREWSTHEIPGNDGAVAFWRHAIPVPFTETSDSAGTTQRSVIAG